MPPAYLPTFQRGKSYLGIATVSPIKKASVQLQSPFNLFHSSINSAHFLSRQKTNPKGNSTSGLASWTGVNRLWGEKISTMESGRSDIPTPPLPQPLPFALPVIQCPLTCAHGHYSHGPFQLFILDGVVKGLGEERRERDEL